MGTECRVDESEQCRPAFLYAVVELVGAVYRNIDQKAWLGLLAVFLKQGDSTRKSRFAAVSRSFHGKAANGFGETVIAESALIEFGERLDKNDAAVLLALSRGLDGVIRKTFGTDGAFVRCLVPMLNHP